MRDPNLKAGELVQPFEEGLLCVLLPLLLRRSTERVPSSAGAGITAKPRS
jgi:hypothetical protein